MPRKYSEQYIDKLLQGSTYGDLVDLSRAICSSTDFSIGKPFLGPPLAAFVFVETLNWFAQSIRSGVCTYYEATATERQEEMHQALIQFAPAEFGDKYLQGMRDWRDGQKIRAVDQWIEINDDVANVWLRSLTQTHRDVILAITA